MNRHGLAISVEHKLRKTQLKFKQLALKSEESSKTVVDNGLKNRNNMPLVPPEAHIARKLRPLAPEKIPENFS